jgi:adenosine deaminase
MVRRAAFKDMPKIELHRHLEGSIRPSTAWRLAQTQNIDLGFADYPGFASAALVREPIGGLDKVIGAMALTRKILASAIAIEEVAYECVRDAKADRIKLFELRFAPALLAQVSGLDYPEIIDAVAKGANKAASDTDGKQKYAKGAAKAAAAEPDAIEVGLICSLRRTSPQQVNAAIVKAMLETKSRALPLPLVGVDLSDNEFAAEPESFAGFFDALREAGFGTTVHSGLNTSPAHLWRTMKVLKPSRVGHGILALGDQTLVDEMRRRDVHLEVSVLSNWITEAVPTVRDHQLPGLLKAGLSVGVNSDDPGLFGSSLSEEYELLERTFGLSGEDFMAINLNALRCSFLPEETKDKVRKAYFAVPGVEHGPKKTQAPGEGGESNQGSAE